MQDTKHSSVCLKIVSFSCFIFLFFVVVFSKSQNVTVSGAMALKTLAQACYHQELTNSTEES